MYQLNSIPTQRVIQSSVQNTCMKWHAMDWACPCGIEASVLDWGITGVGGLVYQWEQRTTEEKGIGEERKYIEESRTAPTSSIMKVAPTTMNDAQPMQDRRRLGQRLRVTLNNHRACDKPRTSDINQSPDDSATTPVPPPKPPPLARTPEAWVLCTRSFHSSPGRADVPPAAENNPLLMRRVIHVPRTGRGVMTPSRNRRRRQWPSLFIRGRIGKKRRHGWLIFVTRGWFPRLRTSVWGMRYWSPAHQQVVTRMRHVNSDASTSLIINESLNIMSCNS